MCVLSLSLSPVFQRVNRCSKFDVVAQCYLAVDTDCTLAEFVTCVRMQPNAVSVQLYVQYKRCNVIGLPKSVIRENRIDGVCMWHCDMPCVVS